jgi:molybdopterin converting factor small subunit
VPEVTLRLPRSLRALFPGCPAELKVPGRTLLDAIDALDGQVPGMRNRLLDAGPEIRRHLNLFIDGEIADLSTALHEGAVVRIVPAVSGGCFGWLQAPQRREARNAKTGTAVA